MAKTPTWQRAAGKNPEGGLNEAGRRSLRAAGHDIKRPQPEGGPRKKSFCSRMRGMKAKLTSAETANDPDSRINKSLRKWKCADGGEVVVDNALRMARGRPDEGRQEEFLREQLAGSVPQYEPSQDFPARAERAVQTADRYAGMLNDLAARGAMMPREFESPQGRGAREIVESALPQDPNAIVKQAMRQAGEGNRLAAAETMLGGIPETGAIRAYHGSPHRFDRFDLSKIGSGEGAQAYGHGLYFAESEPVARSYRDANQTYATFLNDEPIDPAHPQFAPIMSIGAHGYDKALKQAEEFASAGFIKPSEVEAIRKLRDAKIEQRPSGHMYEVEIAAEPHQLLDWDKPLSEQLTATEKLRSIPLSREAIEDLGGSKKLLHGSKTVRDFYDTLASLSGVGDVAGASKAIRAAGIPGIKYLDQGSRALTGGQLIDVFQGPKGWQSRIKVLGRGGTGFQSPTDSVTTSKPFLTEAEARDWANSKINSGTRNYVIFDPSIIDIKRRYADGGEVENALRMARNMGGGALYNQLNYALNSPTPANPPQDPGPQQPYYQSLPQTRDMIQQYGSPAPQAPSSSPVRQPMPYAKGGKAVWEKSRPKDLGKSKPLSPSQKASAKAAAKAAGRPYPNLIDNMRAARKATQG